jgi:Carboxypeptidase regulatory-like domain
MNRYFIAGIAMLLVALRSASARDCHTSKEFELKRAQVVGGVLVDPSEAVLPGMRLELLWEDKIVRQLRTDTEGSYNFGELQPGKYKIRIQDKTFCAPKIKCKSNGCKVEPKLSFGPNVKFVQVE